MSAQINAIKKLLFDSGRATADHAVDILLKKPELLHDFSALAFSNEYPFDMRASNVIEKADVTKHGFAAELIPEIIRQLNFFRNDGPRRQFLRMLIRYVHEIDEDLTGVLYDCCFGFAINGGQPVAVRHNATLVLGELGKRYPDLNNEIVAALKLRLSEESGPFGSWLREFIKT